MAVPTKCRYGYDLHPKPDDHPRAMVQLATENTAEDPTSKLMQPPEIELPTYRYVPPGPTGIPCKEDLRLTFLEWGQHQWSGPLENARIIYEEQKVYLALFQANKRLRAEIRDIKGKQQAYERQVRQLGKELDYDVSSLMDILVPVGIPGDPTAPECTIQMPRPSAPQAIDSVLNEDNHPHPAGCCSNPHRKRRNAMWGRPSPAQLLDADGPLHGSNTKERYPLKRQKMEQKDDPDPQTAARDGAPARAGYWVTNLL